LKRSPCWQAMASTALRTSEPTGEATPLHRGEEELASDVEDVDQVGWLLDDDPELLIPFNLAPLESLEHAPGAMLGAPTSAAQPFILTRNGLAPAEGAIGQQQAQAAAGPNNPAAIPAAFPLSQAQTDGATPSSAAAPTVAAAPAAVATEKHHHSASSLVVDPTLLAAAAAFECNVCLELAKDPVVTLCGHLYCWPCLYRRVEYYLFGLCVQDSGLFDCVRLGRQLRGMHWHMLLLLLPRGHLP
jgi:hypothetical protein